MNRHTKYFFIIKNMITLFILTLLIGAFIKIVTIYYDISPNIFDSIIILVKVFRTIMIITIIIEVIYLIYQISNYVQSAFYNRYHINVFEALFQGILDMYVIYDQIHKLDDAKDIKSDFQNNAITYFRNGKYYSILFVDLFGKIEGQPDTETWTIISKPRNKFGRRVYTQRSKISNPLVVNKKYVAILKEKSGQEYQDYVVISGFYKLKFTSKKIISPYEIMSL